MAGATQTSMATTIEVMAIATDERMRQAWAIRRKVFIEEQRVPEELELDADDARAAHALALWDGEPVGCGRMIAADAHVKIGRMAVLADKRGHGVGRLVLEFLLDRARKDGFRRAVLHAQLSAEGFYLKQGFAPRGGVFEEAGIMHREMTRDL
jgi:predicted GNAT family N-acyltransferase